LEAYSESVSKKSKDAFKAYFNGNTTISTLAKSIIAYIEPEQFVEYINGFQDQVIENLCDSFRDVIPDIDNRNCSEKIAYLFQDIIKTAASTKRNSPTKKRTTEDATEIKLPPSTTGSDEGNNSYSDADNALLREFNADYDEIIEKCFSDKYAQEMIDRTLPIRIESLFNAKWRTKSEQFQDIMLKSNVLALLGKLNEFCSALDPKINVAHMPVRIIRKNLRNLYTKLHPSEYLGVFPYDAFIEDWNEGEDY
jgi:hypothetical protein